MIYANQDVCRFRNDTAARGTRFKPVSITGIPNADTIALERLDASTIRSTTKKGDQVVMTVTSVNSKDGKTRTATFKGKNAEGLDVNNVVVYDKQ
jgi:hypothetical protein